MEEKHDLEQFLRFFEVLPSSGDIELGVLKCHLLIEEVLTKLIEKSVRHPKFIEKARLTFAQKMQIAQSVIRGNVDAWVWVALDKMNKARNTIGHGLTASKIIGTINVFVSFVEANENHFNILEGNEKFTKFHYAAFAVYSRISIAADHDRLLVKMPSLLSIGASQITRGNVAD